MTTAQPGLELVDPTVTTVGVSAQMARRPRTLDGLSIGLLNNGKKNADYILDSLYGMLCERYSMGSAVHHYKDIPSKPFSTEVIDDVAGRCQLAITAVGD